MTTVSDCSVIYKKSQQRNIAFVNVDNTTLSCTIYFIYLLFYLSNTIREFPQEGQIKVFLFDYTISISYFQETISQANFHLLKPLSSAMKYQQSTPCITLLTIIIIISAIADILFMIIVFLE